MTRDGYESNFGQLECSMLSALIITQLFCNRTEVKHYINLNGRDKLIIDVNGYGRHSGRCLLPTRSLVAMQVSKIQEAVHGKIVYLVNLTASIEATNGIIGVGE